MVLDFGPERRYENSDWHTDVTFIETPPLGSILHGVIIPDVGGDTIFADLGAAYDALSAPVKTLLSGLSARHDFAKSFRRDEFATPEYAAKWDRTRQNPSARDPSGGADPSRDGREGAVRERGLHAWDRGAGGR